MLYNLKAREDSGAIIILCLIFIFLPRFSAKRAVYFTSSIFLTLSIVLLTLPVYRIHGFSKEFNYSKWILSQEDLVTPEVINVIESRNVQALYYEPTSDKTLGNCWFVLLHGGGFTSGTAANMNYIGSALSNLGYPAFSLSYSLAPKYVYPYQIREVDSLIFRVRMDAYFSSFKNLPFIIVGESAGATIALNYASREHDSALAKIVNLYGITDPGFIFAESKISNADLEVMINSYAGGTSVDVISPLRNASNIKVPVITFHGTDDVIVPFSQSVEFHNKRRNLGFIDDKLFLLKGATHLFDHPLSGPSGQFFIQKLLDENVLAVKNNKDSDFD